MIAPNALRRQWEIAAGRDVVTERPPSDDNRQVFGALETVRPR
jgi:hypothetical protein